MNLSQQIEETTRYIRSRTALQPTVGLILGSGLGDLADTFTEAVRIPYSEVPHFPVSGVHGHANELVIGHIQGKTAIAMKGRFHFYEGFTMQQVTFPVRVMRALGVTHLIVTNASGGINPTLYPGALMIIKDHINFMGTNPLIGPNLEEMGPRFPDMSGAYNKQMIALGTEVAAREGIEVFTGIHTAVTGPYYFSPAELNMVRSFHSDSIGMSTVPEIIVAAHCGMKSMGICCITDMAIPEEVVPLDHAVVMEEAKKARPRFVKLVTGIIAGL